MQKWLDYIYLGKLEIVRIVEKGDYEFGKKLKT
jgi:hypothetical protein